MKYDSVLLQGISVFRVTRNRMVFNGDSGNRIGRYCRLSQVEPVEGGICPKLDIHLFTLRVVG